MKLLPPPLTCVEYLKKSLEHVSIISKWELFGGLGLRLIILGEYKSVEILYMIPPNTLYILDLQNNNNANIAILYVAKSAYFHQYTNQHADPHITNT